MISSPHFTPPCTLNNPHHGMQGACCVVTLAVFSESALHLPRGATLRKGAAQSPKVN